MADERDQKVSQKYRDLGSEEPPPELDRAILAASRGAAGKPHAPLVTPAGRHRWYFSLGAAAIVVLAVTVTLHVERERPDPESAVAARAPEAQKVEPAATADRAQQAPARVEQAKPAPRPQAAPSKPASPVFVPDQPLGAAREEARAAGPAPAPASPEHWLERIAQLRKQGRHEEADKALAEFRKLYPDFRIPESMLEKVENR